MPGINTRPASVEVYWKYRLEGIESKRLGAKLDKPNMDSDLALVGIQNMGLVTVDFIPTAENIDLYYQSLNASGRGPAVNIVPTSTEFRATQAIQDRSTQLIVAGASSDLFNLSAGDILKIDDELITVERISQQFVATIVNVDLLAFWSLDEVDGVRESIYDLYSMQAFATANLVGSAPGPQTGILAAAFTGVEALRTPYSPALSLARTNTTGFTISCWVYLESGVPIGDQVFVSRWGNDGAGRREFQLRYDSVNDVFNFQIQNVDGTVSQVNATRPPLTDTWFHLCAWYHHTANRIFISVNSTTADSAERVGTSPDTSVETLIGARTAEVSSDNIELADNLRGRVANVGYWNRILTDAERSDLFIGYTISSSPRIGLVFEDRGAHGTKPEPHAIDALVIKMRSTVPTNSIIMDALSDDTVPSAPVSLICSASGDDAEIGFEVIIEPPAAGRKTIHRIQIQAKEVPVWPATIEHTTGVRTILTGQHVGTIRQGGKSLVTTADLSNVVPDTLYTYTDIDVDTGVIVDPFAYSIESIVGNEIRIFETFNVNVGKTDDPQEVNFFVFRGWLDAPADYVVNDPPIVSPPAGSAQAHEPYQQFYKTTLAVYVRARYINRRGAGPWIYWDGVIRG